MEKTPPCNLTTAYSFVTGGLNLIFFVFSCYIYCPFPDVAVYCCCGCFQAAQQIMELQEAAQIHTGLQPPNVGRSTSLHDMKAIVKTWR